MAAAAQPQDESVPSGTSSEDTPADEPLPSVVLTKDLLYSLMKAELEFREGQWQGPFVTTLAAAQQTRDPRLARRAAEMALSARRTEEALTAIRLWRELSPKSDEATQFFVGLAIMTDKLDEVEPIFAERLQAAPATARGVILFQMQQLLARATDKSGAAAVMTRLVEPYHDTFEGHIVLAQAAATRGAGDAAITEARAALAMKPDSELAVLALAQVMGGDETVVKLLDDFLARNPNAREVRAAHARMLIAQKQYKQAREDFLVLNQAQPDNLGTLYAIGIMSLQLGESKVAEQYLNQFMRVFDAHPAEDRDASKVVMLLSQIAEDRGDIKGAQKWLDKIDSGNAQAQFQAQLKRAQLVGKQGDLKTARATLDGIKTEDAAEQAQVALTQGQILRDAGKYQDAYASLGDAAKRFPGNPDVLYDYALAAEKVGQVDVMEKTLREVIAQAPDNHHAYNALGYSLAERNIRLDEAYALIDKALKMAPDDPFIMDSMGWVQYRLGKLKEAEDMLRRAYALRNDADIAVHLGEVLWQAGKKADAKSLLREARTKDPHNDTLRNTLARLNVKL